MTTQPTVGAAPAAPARQGQLALAFQETLTAVVRLRAGRQVAADADSFRAHVKHLLHSAEEEARAGGYAGEDVRYAMFAVVAFLDESVLNSPQPMFAGWARRPLQDELFGGHLGGEQFFAYLQHLLTRPDSPALADLIEVFHLCLLLGFRGRYSGTDGAELRVLAQQAGERVTRVRGLAGPLSPHWAPPDDAPPAAGDPWARRLAVGAAGATVLAAALWVAFKLSLAGGVDLVREAAARAGA